ncbi:hypothetical protein ACHAXA_010002 [Cyclostephanos tholiformis]|uniref:Uncharacterized protein n=1 Tax=Cyclostephanos tholiformis TaxID=382380 RepID=A0ABD3RQU2_9STRA
MAARILISRGSSIIGGVKYRPSSSLLNPDNKPASSSRLFSSHASPEPDGGGANAGPSPPRRRHPQSFVQPDIDLDLGELETELPPGLHQRMGRGLGSDRHANDGRDSYWRPPWRNPRAEIVTAEDFANRPRVTFSESFLTMQDGMVVLSWMSQEDKDGMYGLYLDMMTTIAGGGGGGKSRSREDVANDGWGILSANTSHEYVVRVVAQKYNVTTSRAGGVIQLQHNEEQLKKDPTFDVNYALQAHMDDKMREYIREVYNSYGEKDPLQFVEDPIASTGRIGREDTGSDIFVTASELADVDALLRTTKMREIEEARMRIANHMYVEDVDERTRRVPVDQEVRRLMKMGEELSGLYETTPEDKENEEGRGEGSADMMVALSTAKSANEGEIIDGEGAPVDEGGTTAMKTNPRSVAATKAKNRPRTEVPKIPKGASPFPDNNRGYNEIPETRRPRWKFAAQIINTHALENPPGSSHRGKKAAARAKARRHGRVVEGNTIIEEGGALRIASVAELELTSWKHVRNESEFMFKGVKDAWLRRQLEGEVGGWGYQKEVFKVEPKLMEINGQTGVNVEGEDVDGGGEDDC